MRRTIGVACIAKNEEAMIGRMLESVSWADQCVVVDTGSTDRTVQIAKDHGAEVYLDFVWTDHMSDANNHAKSKLKTDFVLSIDCDEMLLSTEAEVRAAVELAKDVVRVYMVAEGETKTDFEFGRIFRNTPDIFWVSSIHKHLNLPGVGEPVGNVKIMFGHSPAHQLDPDRSLRMLERAVNNEENIIRNLYYLGREYWYKKRYQESIDTFQRYVKVATWGAEASDAYLIMAQAYACIGNGEEAARSCQMALLINSNFKEAIQFMSEICLPENKLQWQRMARSANNEGVLWKRTEVESPSTILISPHQDDEVMFACFSLLRKKPLVVSVTYSAIQPLRGEVGCGAEARRQETIKAMEILGCPVVFIGIPDYYLDEETLKERLRGLERFADKIYIPAYHTNGNEQHNLINKVCLELFGIEKVEQYCTYTKTDLLVKGQYEVVPTKEEIELKNKALDCFKSQIKLKSMSGHFEFIRNKSEWLL